MIENTQDNATLSLSDIARMAGTSTATVSRTLSGRGPVSQAVAARIHKVVRETGYVPNASASALARKRCARPGFVHNTVALAILRHTPTQDNSTVQTIALHSQEGVFDAANELGLDVVMCYINREDLQRGVPPASLARARIDGILVHPGRMLDHSALGTIAPTVFFVSTPSRVPQFPVVQIDDPLGIDTLLKHLMELGHRRIDFISPYIEPPVVHIPFQVRRDAFESLTGEYGVQGRVVSLPESMEANYAAEFAAMNAEDRPTAIVVSSPSPSLRIMHALADLTVRVPDDVSVVAFDGTLAGSDGYPPMTTWDPDWRTIGRTALQTLVKVIAKESVPRQTLIGGELVLRKSTAAPWHAAAETAPPKE